MSSHLADFSRITVWQIVLVYNLLVTFSKNSPSFSLSLSLKEFWWLCYRQKSISSGLLPWKQSYVRGCKFAIFKDKKLLCVIQFKRSEKTPQYSWWESELSGKDEVHYWARMLCLLVTMRSNHHKKDIIWRQGGPINYPHIEDRL